MDIHHEIDHCIELLNQGGVILCPTDTVWGISCDATNVEAVSKIFQLKEREDSKSMIVLIHDENQLYRYVKEVPEISWDLLDASDKPMTIIYPEAKNLASNVIANDNSIGIRIVNEGFVHQLIKKFKRPLVSTSANISGTTTPKTFDDIQSEILQGVDYVVNSKFETNKSGKSSAIIKLGLKGEIEIIRK